MFIVVIIWPTDLDVIIIIIISVYYIIIINDE